MGNPFRIGVDGAREEVIAKFERYGKAKGLDKRARAYRGETLGCFCKPLACHGDIVAAWADAED